MTQKTDHILVEEIAHIERPDRALAGLLADTMPFLLESAMKMERYGRYSILGSDPVAVIRSKNGLTEVIKDGAITRSESDPLEAVAAVIESFGALDEGEYSWLPFTGGAVGYFGYDLNRQIEVMPDLATDDQRIPDIYVGFYTEAIVIDHKERRSYAISYVPERVSLSKREATRRLHALISKVIQGEGRSGGNGRRIDGDAIAGNLRSNFTKEQFRHMILRAKEYISAGDIFQVNLAQRFVANIAVDHYSLYRRLRAKNPAPFAAFLCYGDFSILSSSPERFMRVDDRYVETRPIKGTRPRCADTARDRRSIEELIRSEKDAAEHVMIVDVKRNDLGRVCRVGSVRVPDLMVVESYKSVHHLVSTVVGELRPEVGMMDLLRASFPGGSISGAPKIRAMEIIEELEPCRRNIYTGSIGYISTNRKMDTNIVIRTIVAKGDKAYLHVGGGIVADSNPDAEYQETLDKGHALFNALGVEATG